MTYDARGRWTRDDRPELISDRLGYPPERGDQDWAYRDRMHVISLDCESNGLGGQAFAAAAVLTDDTGAELDVWTARCPIAGTVDPWVRQYVLPAVAGMPETVHTYEGLLTGWCDWYGRIRAQLPYVLLVVHVLWPVEARFLLDAYEDNPREGPYPIDDVACYLRAAGRNPKSVDAYLADHNLPVPEGSPHHPLYDARAAERAFRHLMGHRVLLGQAS